MCFPLLKVPAKIVLPWQRVKKTICKGCKGLNIKGSFPDLWNYPLLELHFKYAKMLSLT